MTTHFHLVGPIIQYSGEMFQLLLSRNCGMVRRATLRYQYHRNRLREVKICGTFFSGHRREQHIKVTDESHQISQKSLPFRRSSRGTFFQERPKLGNVFEEDATLKASLKRILPQSVCSKRVPWLENILVSI